MLEYILYTKYQALSLIIRAVSVLQIVFLLAQAPLGSSKTNFVLKIFPLLWDAKITTHSVNDYDYD